MNTAVYFDISLQTAEGPKRFARFELGPHREAARLLFDRLKGAPEVNLKDMLYIELVEMINGLPMNLDIKTCDLQQLGTNSMLITQEIFRLSNLKNERE